MCLATANQIIAAMTLLLSFAQRRPRKKIVLFELNTTMDYICNKCWVTNARANKPFRFTQCKHIFCDNCIKDVTEQCTVCGFKLPLSISLQEPLPSEVAFHFMPLDNTLSSLRKAAGVQSEQLNIILERLNDIKNKYHGVKMEYRKVIQRTDYLIRKCNEYKNDIKKMKEELKDVIV